MSSKAQQLHNALLSQQSHSIPLIDKSHATVPILPIRKTSLSLRKQHELDQLSSLLSKDNVEFIIDVGSGGGYLSRHLPSLRFINVENNTLKSKSAVRNSLNLGINNAYSVKSLDDDFTRFIDSHKRDNKGIPNGVIIGLDSCGDLANEILERFVRNDIPGINLVKCYVLPCCHWKLSKFLHHDLEVEFEIYKGQDTTNWTEEEALRFEEEEDDDDWRLRNWKYLVLENLVIDDKVEYLIENKISNTRVEIVFDYRVSSRNLCIIAQR